jgi:hypothetical protein
VEFNIFSKRILIFVYFPYPFVGILGDHDMHVRYV